MVASRQVEIPFYRSLGRQRGKGFRALAQVIVGTEIPLFREQYFLAKRVGADVMEFASPNIEEEVGVRNNLRTAVKNVRKQTLRKQLGSSSRIRIANRDTGTKFTKQTIGCKDSFGRQYYLIMSNSFHYQFFEALSCNLGRTVLIVDNIMSSHQEEVYHTN